MNKANQEIVYPSELDYEVKYALKHFPELKDVQINFKWGVIAQKSFMLAQPVPSTLLKNKKDRVYQIIMRKAFFIENKQFKNGQVPSNVIIGWLGHELGHVLDYKNRSSLNLAWFGIKYFFSKRFLIQAEITADKNAVEHGLIEEIVLSKQFARNPTYFPTDYIAKLIRYYPSIELVKSWA